MVLLVPVMELLAVSVAVIVWLPAVSAVLLNASWAVTVNVKPVPAVAEAGAATVKCVAAAALTRIVLLVPVIELLLVSVAVIVWLPAVLSVALNVPVPLLSGLLASGRL